jgi:ATP phosphoribosyltransferase
MRLKIALPKGRLMESTKELLEKSGIQLEGTERNYRPDSNQPEIDFYIIKPRNIPKMVEEGLFDAGIVGLDLVEDEGASLKSMADLKLMPVYLIVASADDSALGKEKITVASEYTGITEKYFAAKGKQFKILKTYGSTECFVPEFADVIVDHTQTGTSLKQNGLQVKDLILRSTTNLFATSKLSEEKLLVLERLKEKLLEGLEKMDLSYPNFLTEEQIRTNKF